MNLRESYTCQDATIEQCISALPVNAAHRRMALIQFRDAMAAAECVFDFSESVFSFAGTIRRALGERKRRVDSGLG